MAAHILTSTIIGLDGYRVEVECDISPGLPSFSIVGLPDTAVQEARERVRSAMKHSDLPFPRTRITINLAPADLRKSGTGFDLPIAIAILVASGDVPSGDVPSRLFVGELALDGSVRPVPGVLSTALLAMELKMDECIVPIANASEAAMVPGLAVFAATSLRAVADHLANVKQLDVASPPPEVPIIRKNVVDFSFVRGQEQAKRALEIAAAGGHNLLMEGPPGSGKTLLARAFPSIMPLLTYEESLDVTRIHSVAGLLSRDGFLRERPFRSPHHTSSGVALVGGGSIPKPGEITLAHRGVLFLDEFPEFTRAVLENLRQPLEDGFVTIARAQGTVAFPARFSLIAAMNPCACGYRTDQDRACICTPLQLINYRKRISGPLLDRIDLLLHVPKVPPDRLIDGAPGETSEVVRDRVWQARERQRIRYQELHLVTNSELTSEHVRRFVAMEEDARQLMRQAVDRFRLSARAYFRALKVARTIADLAGCEQVDTTHIAEALQYRQMGDG